LRACFWKRGTAILAAGQKRVGGTAFPDRGLVIQVAEFAHVYFHGGVARSLLT
jgi:hypothetical protein